MLFKTVLYIISFFSTRFFRSFFIFNFVYTTIYKKKGLQISYTIAVRFADEKINNGVRKKYFLLSIFSFYLVCFSLLNPMEY